MCREQRRVAWQARAVRCEVRPAHSDGSGAPRDQRHLEQLRAGRHEQLGVRQLEQRDVVDSGHVVRRKWIERWSPAWSKTKSPPYVSA